MREVVLGFTTMYDIGLSGNSDWQKCSVVLDVPAIARDVLVCATLHGSGELLFSNLSFGAVDAGIETTDRRTMKFPSRAAVAEILYWPSATQTVRRVRVMAQNTVRLPDNTDLEVHLTFDGQQQMQPIEQLGKLRVIAFSAAQLDVEDKQLTYIKSFKNLRSLDFDQTLISDKVLPAIATLKSSIIYASVVQTWSARALLASIN